jgi:voltage-gated potassium channel
MGRLRTLVTAATEEVRMQLAVDDIALAGAPRWIRTLRWGWESLMVAGAVLAVAWCDRHDTVALRVQWAIWGAFVADYGARLWAADDRRAFVRTNLVDLLAIVPVDLVRGLRALRALRLVRSAVVLWRVLRTARTILSTTHTWSLLVVAAGLVTVGGVTAAQVEPGITSIGDGLWWAIVTATTVGYGDISPVTPFGRGIAAVLMLTGIGVLGAVTGAIATHTVDLAHMASDSDPDDPDVAHTLHRLLHWDELSVAQRQRLTDHLVRLAADPATGPDRARDGT